METTLSYLSYLSDQESFVRHAHEDGDRQRELFEAATSEAENFGVLSAVVCCTLNDLRDRGASTLPNFILGFLPSDPILLQNLRKLSGGVISADLEMHLIYLNGQIYVAKALLRESVEEKKGFLTHNDVDQISHAWRGVCDHILLAIAYLDALFPDGRVTAQQIDRIKLEHSLLDAREGGTELSLNRDFNFPTWAQKRRHRRVMLNDIGSALIDGRVHTVLITDISVGGLGLDFTEGVRKGDAITVTLSTGRSFQGRISWSAGTRSGLQFDEALPHNDILFSWESV